MQAISDFFKENKLLGEVAWLILSIVIALVVVIVLFKILERVFPKLQHGKKKNLTSRMIENGVRFVIIFVAVQWVMMSSNLTKGFGQTLFRGTAVVAAIAGFAAQNVLADMLCGAIISLTKPFEIGDRIMLESGIAGIVKDLTPRHVVLQGIDTQQYVIPNSRLNTQRLTNMSWHTDIRSVDFRFNVGYGSDTDETRRIIRQAIMDSPLSVPGKGRGQNRDYADVYFLEIGEYSLVLGTTAYYKPSVTTEVFKTDINTRVKKALDENHIEIPYRYVTVEMKS